MPRVDEHQSQTLEHILGITGKLLRVCLDNRLRENDFGINYQQGLILTYLSQNDGIASQQQIADYFHQDKTLISRVIDSLEEAGLIRRVANPKDKRTNSIQVAPRGQKLYRSVWRATAQAEDHALRGIEENDLQTCLAVLEKIRKNLCP